MRKPIFALLFVLLLAAFTFAQDNDLGKNEWSVWGGFSPDSNTSIKGTGRTPDARFGIAAVRYARRFNFSDSFNVKYTADFVPVAALNYPDIGINPGPPATFVSIRPTRTAWGASPLGGQVNFRPTKKYQPFIEATGGFLFMNQRTPNFTGTHFQYTADVGGGVEIRVKDGKAVTLGYKYYHISNGNRGISNPGFDNNLFYVGYTFFSN